MDKDTANLFRFERPHPVASRTNKDGNTGGIKINRRMVYDTKITLDRVLFGKTIV